MRVWLGFTALLVSGSIAWGNAFWPDVKNIVAHRKQLEVRLTTSTTLLGMKNWYTLSIVIEDEEIVEVCAAGSYRNMEEIRQKYHSILDRAEAENLPLLIGMKGSSCNIRLEPVITIF